ncbi:hypothetical protein KSS87_000645, partial [Heliosperma pusillum]
NVAVLAGGPVLPTLPLVVIDSITQRNLAIQVKKAKAKLQVDCSCKSYSGQVNFVKFKAKVTDCLLPYCHFTGTLCFELCIALKMDDPLSTFGPVG